MKKEISLKINSKQYAEKLHPSGAAFMRALELEDTVEVLTTGTMYTKNGATYIMYDESELGGLQDNRTMVKVLWKEDQENVGDPKSIQIKRFSRGGQDDMDMTLEKGILNLTRYKLPGLGSLDLEIYTIKAKAQFDEEGNGTVSVDFRLRFDADYSRRNMLEMEVKVNG